MGRSFYHSKAEALKPWVAHNRCREDEKEAAAGGPEPYPTAVDGVGGLRCVLAAGAHIMPTGALSCAWAGACGMCADPRPLPPRCRPRAAALAAGRCAAAGVHVVSCTFEGDHMTEVANFSRTLVADFVEQHARYAVHDSEPGQAASIAAGPAAHASEEL